MTRWGVSRLVVLAAAGAVAVVLGLVLSGAAAPSVLGDPGALVRWGLPLAETAAQLAASLTIGSLVLAVCILPRRVEAAADRGGDGRAAAGAHARTAGTTSARAARSTDARIAGGTGARASARSSSRTGARTAARTAARSAARTAVSGAPVVDGRAYPAALTLAGCAAAVWTALSVFQLVLTYARIAGRPVGGPTFGSELGLFIGEVSLGRTLLGVVVVAALTSAVALAVATPTGATWGALLALVALVLQSQTGHTAGATDHELAITSLFLHLVGAAVWIGALAALAALQSRLGSDVGAAVARYSPVAAWCFVAVAVSGTVNSVLRLGGVEGLFTRYGALLSAKVLLFAVLGALGWAYRRTCIPQLTSADGERTARATGLLWRLVGVEVLVMGAVSGVAVALSVTPPPVPDVPVTEPTPAEIVTGHALPPAPVGSVWWTEWRPDLLLAAGCAAGIVVYLRWVLRLRRRGDAWPWYRSVLWVAGMVLVGFATSGSLATYGHVLFSVHMVQHMVLAMVAPILLALAAPVTLALRALPARRDDSRGPREWVLTLVESRVGQFLSLPLVAAVNFAGSMVVFYYTGLFELSLTTYLGHLGMVVHFSLAGYLFVNALVGVDPSPHRPGYPQRLLLLLGTMAFHAFFGVALMSGEVLLVPDWFGVLGRDWGPSALEDQQRGGAIAWGIGEVPTIALAILAAFSWSRDDERIARRRDRRVDREGDREMDEYNAMLARLADGDGRTPTGPGGRDGSSREAGEAAPRGRAARSRD